MVDSIPKIKGFYLKHNICRCICSLTQIFGIDSMHLNISRTFICSPILFFVVALIVIRYLEKILGVNSTFGWVWRDNQSNVPYLILRKTLVLIKWENVDLDWVKKNVDFDWVKKNVDFNKVKKTFWSRKIKCIHFIQHKYKSRQMDRILFKSWKYFKILTNVCFSILFGKKGTLLILKEKKINPKKVKFSSKRSALKKSPLNLFSCMMCASFKLSVKTQLNFNFFVVFFHVDYFNKQQRTEIKL